MTIDRSSVTVRTEEQTLDGALDLTVIVEAQPSVGVDRPQVHAWGLGAPSARTRKLAERLAAAVLSGRAFRPAVLKTDVRGKSYVAADTLVYGRTLNADLKRIGF